MPIIRRFDCVPLPIVVCPVVAVVMLESRVSKMCALCGECCLPTQWTGKYRQWNAVGSPDDGNKDA